MNVFTFSGRLGKDCRVNQAGSTTVCNFTVAVDSGFGDKKQTLWLDCSLFGKRAETRLPEFLVKGTQVVVSGELGTREYDGKTYLTCKVGEVDLVGGKQDGQSAPQPQQQQQSQQFDDFNDEVPFYIKTQPIAPASVGAYRRSDMADLFKIILSVVVMVACFVLTIGAWAQHFVTSISQELWVLFIVGVFVPPVGIFHGWLIWLGVL